MEMKQMKKSESKTLPNLSEDVRIFLKSRKSLRSYELQEDILQNFTQKHLSHEVYEEVEIKAKLLNMFYSTGIQAIDSMVRNIMSIKDIDIILKKPKYCKGLVDAIADLKLKDDKKRNNYSFATKYCALHQPDKYPIYDSIVAAIFTKLMVKGELPPYTLNKGRRKNSNGNYMTKGEFEEKMRDYDFFVKVYDTFMKDYGLKKSEFSYRNVDWYLWGSYKDSGIETKIERLTKLDKNKFIPYSIPIVAKTKKIEINS